METKWVHEDNKPQQQQQLHDNPALHRKLCFFVHALLTYSKDKAARKAVDTFIEAQQPASSLSPHFFTPEEQDFLWSSFPSYAQSLQQRMQQLTNKGHSGQGGYRPCAAHLLAPIAIQAFGFDQQPKKWKWKRVSERLSGFSTTVSHAPRATTVTQQTRRPNAQKMPMTFCSAFLAP